MSLNRRQALIQSLAAAVGTAGLATRSGSAAASPGEPSSAFVITDAAATATPGALPGAGTTLTGRIVVPGDAEYDDARHIWNPRFSKYPLAIVYCLEAQDVVNAVTWARANDVVFRIRSGGHGLEGWSLVNGGLIIDLSDMKAVQLDKSAMQVTVQPGIRIGHALEQLIPEGVTIPFGDSHTVGVGGITPGGGIGTLGRTMGLICDNLVALEMVVATEDGGAAVIQANTDENPDLLWACRGGGGGNFGVITSLTLVLHEIPAEAPIYEIDFDHSKAADALTTWMSLALDADDRFGSILEIFNADGGNSRFHGVYLGSEEEMRTIIQPMLDLETASVRIETLPFLQAARFITDSEQAPDTYEPSPVSLKFSSAWGIRPLPAEAIELCKAYIEHPGADMFFLNLGGAVSKLASADTAFFYREAAFYTEWDVRWSDSATEEGPAHLAVEQMRLDMSPYVTGSYVNVPDPDIADWQTAYYGDNAARLRQVKAQYDPTNVFHFEQSIPPAS